MRSVTRRGYCVELYDVDLSAEDGRLPAPGDSKFYLVRVENACGPGPVDSDPPPAVARSLRYLRVDNTDDDGPGSLRQVIVDAEDGDSICFEVTGTIGLESALDVDKNVTIWGPGADSLTLDRLGTVAQRTVILQAESVLAGVTIRNATATSDSEAITVWNGSPTLRSTTVTGAERGVYVYQAPLTVRDSRITDNGFGFYLMYGGSPTIVASTITSNSSAIYGYYYPDVTIRSSTLSGWITILYDAELTVESSTLTGGIRLVQSDGVIRSSTIAGRGAAFSLDSDSSLRLRNSVLAKDDNCASNGQNVFSDGFNLATDGSCINLTAAGDRQNTDPLLGPLAGNGGPTETFALLPGSPAIDAGSCPGTTQDQRGAPRPIDDPATPNADDACDVGPYEKQ